MSILIDNLAKFIKRRFVSEIEVSPELNFRVIFSAAPQTYMSDLYSLLIQDSTAMVVEVAGRNIDRRL